MTRRSGLAGAARTGALAVIAAGMIASSCVTTRIETLLAGPGFLPPNAAAFFTIDAQREPDFTRELAALFFSANATASATSPSSMDFLLQRTERLSVALEPTGKVVGVLRGNFPKGWIELGLGSTAGWSRNQDDATLWNSDGGFNLTLPDRRFIMFGNGDLSPLVAAWQDGSRDGMPADASSAVERRELVVRLDGSAFARFAGDGELQALPIESAVFSAMVEGDVLFIDGNILSSESSAVRGLRQALRMALAGMVREGGADLNNGGAAIETESGSRDIAAILASIDLFADGNRVYFTGLRLQRDWILSKLRDAFAATRGD